MMSSFMNKGYDSNGNLNVFKGFQWYDYDNERAFKPNEMWNDEMMLMGYLAKWKDSLLNLMKFKWAIL